MFELDKSKSLWLRQADEDDEAWNAFYLYRDLGLQRSREKAVAAFQSSRPEIDPQVAALRVRSWYAKWSWQERARAWDNAIEGAREDGVLKEASEIGARQYRSGLLLEEVADHIALELVKRLEKSGLDAVPATWRDVVFLYDAAYKHQRDGRNEPTEQNVTVTVEHKQAAIAKALRTKDVAAINTLLAKLNDDDSDEKNESTVH